MKQILVNLCVDIYVQRVIVFYHNKPSVSHFRLLGGEVCCSKVEFTEVSCLSRKPLLQVPQPVRNIPPQ